MLKNRLLLLLIAVISLGSAGALAQEAKGRQGTSVSADTHETAVALMTLGMQQFKRNDFKGARISFAESFRLKPTYDVACSLAQTELELGELASAVPHMRYCIDYFPTAGDKEKVATVLQSLEDTLDKLVPFRVVFPEDGMKILLDDREVGTTPMTDEMYLMPGRYLVRVESPDGRSVQRAFAGNAGEKQVLHLHFEEKGERPPTSGNDPLVGENADGAARRNWTPVYVLGGVTVASFTASMIFRGVAGSQGKQVDSLRSQIPQGSCGAQNNRDPRCDELLTTIDRRDTGATGANISLITAGVGAAATLGSLVYLLTTPEKGKRSEPATSVGAWIGPDGGQLALSGRF